MQIKLKWVNNNDASAVVEVFRGTAPINTANPGAALVTLPGNTTTYTDATVLVGVTYYYAVAVSRNGKKIFTPVKTFLNEFRRGPGGSRILFGDERLGYMGAVSQDDFIEIGRVLGLTSTVSPIYRMTWHKFIRKGKIIYLGEKPLNTASSSEKVSGFALRTNPGLVSGLAWNFDNAAWPDAAKTKIVEKNGDRFHFRAPRSLPDDWDGSAPTDALIANPETEFNELIPTLFQGEFPLPNKLGCVRKGTPNTAVTMAQIICAEQSGGQSLIRTLNKTAPNNTSFWPHCGSYARTKEDFLAFTLRSHTGVEPTWATTNWFTVWPMLELID